MSERPVLDAPATEHPRANPHRNAGIAMLCVAWLGYIAQDTLLGCTTNAVRLVARTAKSSTQGPAYKQLDVLLAAESASTLTLAVLLVIGLALVVRGTEAKRRVAAIVALVLGLGALAIAIRFAKPIDYRAPVETWFPIERQRRTFEPMEPYTVMGATVLAIGAAAHRRLPALIAAGAFALRIALSSVLPSAWHPLLLHVVFFVTLVWVFLASRPARDSGLVMRLFAAALVVRIAGGLVVAMWSKRFGEGVDTAASTQRLAQTWAVGLATALLMLGVLGAYASLPAHRRSSVKLGIVSAILLATTVLDAHVAWLHVRWWIGMQTLFGGGSWYGTTELSKQELASMQTMLQTLGGLSLLAGLVGGLVLVRALRETAGSLEGEGSAVGAVARRLGTLPTLLVIVSFGAMGMAVATTSVRNGTVALAFGVLLSIVALVLLGLFMQAFVGLGRALDAVGQSSTKAPDRPAD